MPGTPEAKVINLDAAKRRRKTPDSGERCMHKDVIVYRDSRRVYCVVCGAELDPFDVLVSVVEAQPPGDEALLERREPEPK